MTSLTVAAMGPVDSIGYGKLFFIWACGTTDFVTDIFFLVNSIKTHFAFTHMCAVCGEIEESELLGHLFFAIACIFGLIIVVLLHLWKLMGTFLFMTDDHSDVSFSGVTLANSPGLFFIFCCRPTKLDDFVGFIQDSHPWNPRMLVDMAFEDIPSLVLNSVDMFKFGNGGFLNWLSFLASIAHILVCWWLLRSRETAGHAKSPKAARRVEDGVSAMNSVLGVAEAGG